MSAISLNSFTGRYFTSDIPDVMVSLSSSAVKVVMTLSDTDTGDVYYDETLWPVGGAVSLTDLGTLLEPFARRRLVLGVSLTARQLSSTDAEVASSSSNCEILYSLADVGMSASAFYNSHFLTILDGPKVTAAGRLEYLHYYGSEPASCVATYTDGTTRSFTPSVVSGNGSYTTIDVSPSLFAVEGKAIASYEVTAGSRSQQFLVDCRVPDSAPILIFDNSFGVQELIYCIGTHKVDPSYERKQVRIGTQLRNYRIRETREFHASTGVLTTPMANWADELFRSQEIYVVNIINGQPSVGKEIVITDSKSENSNDDDYLPSFSFTYQYSQRLHNVMQADRAGRIFDNTFDNTFN